MLSLPQVPQPCPRSLKGKLLTALVAYDNQTEIEKGGKAGREMSILYTQALFSISSERGAERLILGLRGGLEEASSCFLEIVKRSRGVRGHVYDLGIDAKDAREVWSEIGRSMFGPGGLLTPFRARPAFGFKGLDTDGCLVLAVVDRLRPDNEEEVIAFLDGYISSNRVHRKLLALASLELIYLTQKEISTPNDLRERLLRFERESGAAELSRRRELQRGERQRRFQEEVLGDATLENTKSLLRKMKGFYCGHTPPPEGGHVEHFPPRKWGGGDETSVLLPGCRTCNTSHGGKLKQAGAFRPVPDEVLELHFPGSPELADDFLFALAYSQSCQYAVSMYIGNVSQAQSAARGIGRLLAARLSGKLCFVSTLTGESYCPSGRPDFIALARKFEFLEAVPALAFPTAVRCTHS